MIDPRSTVLTTLVALAVLMASGTVTLPTGASVPLPGEPGCVVVGVRNGTTFAETCTGEAVDEAPHGTQDARVLQNGVHAAGPDGRVNVTQAAYTLERTLVIPYEGLVLQGVGHPLLNMDVAADTLLLVKNESGTIEDVRVDGLVVRHARDAGSDAVIVHSARNVTVSNVIVQEAREEGLVAYFSTNVTFERNTVYRVGDRTSAVNPGIQFLGTSGSRILNNFIEVSESEGSTVGIQLNGGLAPSDGNVVEGNTILHAGSAGIHLVFDASRNRIVDNHVGAPDVDGIRLRDADGKVPRDNLIEGNTIVDSGRHGINVLAPDNFFIGNRVEDSGSTGTYAGIVVRDPGNVLERNVVTRSTGEGIRIDEADGVEVRDNRLVENARHGILFANGANHGTIEANRLHDNGMAARDTFDGIHVTGYKTTTTTGNEIMGNEISGFQHRIGVHLMSSASGNTVRGNVVLDAEGEPPVTGTSGNDGSGNVAYP